MRTKYINYWLGHHRPSPQNDGHDGRQSLPRLSIILISRQKEKWCRAPAMNSVKKKPFKKIQYRTNECASVKKHFKTQRKIMTSHTSGKLLVGRWVWFFTFWIKNDAHIRIVHVVKTIDQINDYTKAVLTKKFMKGLEIDEINCINTFWIEEVAASSI